MFNFNIFGFKLSTLSTDLLSLTGIFILIFLPLIYSDVYRKFFNKRLHTTEDGYKLFEKLKYDLNLSKIENVDKRRLFRDIDYAKSIFNNSSMDYYKMDVIWYFNELHAKRFILEKINKFAFRHFSTFVLFIGVIFAGSKTDFLWWLFEMQSLGKESGIVSIWVLFILLLIITLLYKIFLWFKLKIIINDQIREINLEKKEKTWKDFKVAFIGENIGLVLGFVFIIINIFFK